MGVVLETIYNTRKEKGSIQFSPKGLTGNTSTNYVEAVKQTRVPNDRWIMECQGVISPSKEKRCQKFYPAAQTNDDGFTK